MKFMAKKKKKQVEEAPAMEAPKVEQVKAPKKEEKPNGPRTITGVRG